MAPSLEPRLRTGPNGTTIVRGFSQPRSAVDQKSIYVGNLPEGTTRDALGVFFSDFGHVLHVNIMRKVYDEVVVNNFAFVEFQHQHEAINAASGDRYFQGVKLRVEAKEYSARQHARTAVASQPTARYNEVGYRADAQIAAARIRHDTQGGRRRFNGGYFGVLGSRYVANDMTPPATARYQRHSATSQAYGTPLQQVVAPSFGLVTPPSQRGMNQMLPAGIFSPPESQYAHNGYGDHTLPFGTGPTLNMPAYQPNTTAYMAQPFAAIDESGEEALY
jgi:RNA recognition motif-containing protein